MKKSKIFALAALLLTAVIMTPAPVIADEDPKLPFELTAPENVSIVYLEERDSANTCQIAYSQNNSMSEWTTAMADEASHDQTVEELQAMGYDDIFITPQMDWSIDSMDDWHYNEYWDTEGYDKDYHMRLGDWAYISLSYGPEVTNTAWVFRWMGNIKDTEDAFWYGRHDEGGDDYPGWKDVLKEDQYDIITNEDESYAKIDLSKHTIYVRMRWLVTIRTEDKDINVSSDWSEIAAVGKDAQETVVLTKDTLKAPVIKDLRMTDETFNDQPVIAFKLEVPDELSKQITQVKANNGDIWLSTEARVEGSDEWIEMQGDFEIRTGELKVTLLHLLEEGKVIEEGTPIELRCRYYCTQEGEEDLYSDYSEVLTFGTKEIKEGEKETVTEAKDQSEDTTVDEEKEDKCSICGFCPHPLGLCIFIWIAILIVIIVIVIIIVRKKKN
ncbi:MAG: hypothetical protein II919_03180 [Lachnospiraceae bacterium]|nr:hypothetical protein [Lachnospiraceae bacterium]